METKRNSTPKGILVFHIYTGTLPSSKANEFLKKIKDELNPQYYGIDTFWFASKSDSRVEYISLQ